jgi:hypothetical protein
LRDRVLFTLATVLWGKEKEVGGKHRKSSYRNFLFQPGDLFSVEYKMMNEYEKMRKTKETTDKFLEIVKKLIEAKNKVRWLKALCGWFLWWCKQL